MTVSSTRVWIDYTNYEGVRAWREIAPTGGMIFSSSRWHPEPQWLMEAFDIGKGQLRMFAVKDIHEWRTTAPVPLISDMHAGGSR